MAPRKRVINSNIAARLVTGKKVPCAFCNRLVDDEILYGKLYAIGNIQCHYYCVLLSSCLIQKGKDEHGLFGFLYEDILIEVQRCKKHKCSYCNQIGANMGCSISQCRKQFHLPCGKEKNSVSLFYGNFKTFCQQHAPKQNIPESIMLKARVRRSRDNKVKKMQYCNFKDLKELSLNENTEIEADTQSVCVICYEQVDGYPTNNTFWPPCCARDAWFHRTCLQRMALSAGIHYLKCPLCNDKEHFYEAVLSQGYYVPDRDAAWELEQNAFADIYARPISCSSPDCACPMGRSHDADNGAWSISMCMLCGSSGQHAGCMPEHAGALHICDVCKPAAPGDLENLANSIEAVISQEQAQTSSRARHGPVMPSRMSLRRTKRNINPQNACTSSQAAVSRTEVISEETSSSNTSSSRETLNLKPPKKPTRKSSSSLNSNFKHTFSPSKSDRSPTKSKYDSPTKIIEETLMNKFGSTKVIVKDELVDELRKRFRKPQPLCAKRRIVNEILNGFFDNLLLEPKQKEPIKQWYSPKKLPEDNDDIILLQDPTEIIDLTEIKDENPNNLNITNELALPDLAIIHTPNNLRTVEIEKDSSLEISAKDEIVNIDVFKIENNENEESNYKNKCSFKFGPCNKEVLATDNIGLDLETFKNQYLNEVSGTKNRDITKKLNRKRSLDKEKIVVELQSKKRKIKRRSISIKNKNIQVKIKWRKEQLKLQFNDIKQKKKFKKYRQYVLKYSPEKVPGDPELCQKTAVLSKPEIDVTPIKRKYIKQEKVADNLVQTSIDKFFKLKSPGVE